MSATLVKKLAEVMAEVERIPKRGHNNFHNYDYATEADIAAAIRTELSKRHVMLIPSITSVMRDPVGDKGSVVTTLMMVMEFRDGETGESISSPWMGFGSDKEDKGGYKAMTGAVKYYLLKTFLMPTGDDPEADQPEVKGQTRTAPARSSAPQRPLPTGPLTPQRPTQARPAKPAGDGVTVTGAKIAKQGQSGKGPWTLHAVTFSDGRQGKTFSASVYKAAQDAMRSGTTVEVDLGEKGDIINLLPVRQLEEAPF